LADAEKFWLRLEELKKVRLANKDGAVITPDALPKSLEQLPDDPYRTLAWMTGQRRDEASHCRVAVTIEGPQVDCVDGPARGTAHPQKPIHFLP
jgi:hypothetical protein